MSLVELPENNSHPRSDSWVVWRIPPHWAAFALIQLLPTASKLPILLSHAFLLDLIRCGLSPLTMCVVQAGHNLLISPKSAFPRLRIKPFNYITCCSLRLVLSDLLRSGCFFFLKKNNKKKSTLTREGYDCFSALIQLFCALMLSAGLQVDLGFYWVS